MTCVLGLTCCCPIWYVHGADVVSCHTPITCVRVVMSYHTRRLWLIQAASRRHPTGRRRTPPIAPHRHRPYTGHPPQPGMSGGRGNPISAQALTTTPPDLHWSLGCPPRLWRYGVPHRSHGTNSLKYSTIVATSTRLVAHGGCFWDKRSRICTGPSRRGPLIIAQFVCVGIE